MTEFIAHIGTDESGKGDFFGPLVIAGVLVDEKNAQYFHELGIKDSKKLSDKKMLSLSVEIKNHAPHSIIAISNPKYNELYSNIKNLNRLLAWGHARAIENILNSSTKITTSASTGNLRKYMRPQRHIHGRTVSSFKNFVKPPIYRARN